MMWYLDGHTNPDDIHYRESDSLDFSGPKKDVSVLDKLKLAKLTNNPVDHFGHNFFLLVTNYAEFGKYSTASWSVTLIDHDNHKLFNSDGSERKSSPRKLILEEGVGIYSNVLTPRGVHLEKGSTVGAGTTLRENVPSKTLVFHNSNLTYKEITYAYNWED